LRSIFEEYLNGNKEFVFEKIDGQTPSGDTVRKTIVVLKAPLSESQIEEAKNFEDSESRKEGYPIRLSFIDSAALSRIPMMFRVSVSPSPRDSGSLDKILFQDRILQAVQVSQISGRKINGDKVVEDFESTWKSKGLFEKPTMAPPMEDSMGVSEAGGVSLKAQSLLSAMQGAGEQMNSMDQLKPKTFPGGPTRTTRFGSAQLGSMRNANKDMNSKGVKS
jgi:hypothetical protein